MFIDPAPQLHRQWTPEGTVAPHEHDGKIA
jgi:hypothetical protein